MVSLGSNGLMGILAAFETAAVRVRPRQCTRLRHRKSVCTRCVDVCPADAITWTLPTMQVDSGKCTGCGLCVAVCPTGALEGRGPSNTELVSKARDLSIVRTTVAFACKTHLRAIGSGPDGCVQVACLGRLDESILVGSVAWGATELLLADGSCEQCPNRKGREVAVGAVARSQRILEAFGSQAEISFVGDLPREMRSGPGSKTAPSGAGVSRRGFFGFLAGRARQTGAVAAETVLPSVLLGDKNEEPENASLKPGELPVYQGLRRRLLLGAMARLGEAKEPTLAGEDGFWQDFEVTSSCTGCRMCAQFCPTGALSKVEGDDHTLRFSPALCTGCMVCRDLCFWKAVSLSPTIDLRHVTGGETTAITLPVPAK